MSEMVSTKGTEMVTPKEIAIKEFNSLRGRLCTVIESAGLEKKQERALITLIKNLSYQNQAVVAELIDTLDTHGTLFRYSEKKLEA